MATDFSKSSITQPTKPLQTKPTGTGLLTGAFGTPTGMSNYYSAPNPAFNPPGSSQLTVPVPKSTAPMGVTAKTPPTPTPAKAPVLPSTQQNPVTQPYTLPTPTPAPTAPVQPPAPTFNGLLGQAINQNQNTAGQANLLNNQSGILNNQSGMINNTAYQIGQYGQMSPEEIDLRRQMLAQPGVTAQAGILAKESSPEILLQGGREGLALQAGEARQRALAGQVDALAQQRGVATQAYTGQANALNQGAGVQNMAGGLQNSAGGLYNAATGQYNALASQAKPELGSIGQVPFSPTTQEQGQILGSTQPGGLQAAGNLLGQFSGAQTAGAALGGVEAQQTAQQEAYKSAHQQAAALQSQVTDLIKQFGLNPSDINLANAGIQKIAQNVSDPRYQILNNYLADIASRYSQVLTPAGGSATDTTRAVAAGMLNGIASGNSIIQVMNALDQQAQAVISTVKTTGGSQGSTGNTQTGVVHTSAGAVNTSW